VSATTTLRRIRAALASGAREYRRTPVFLVLLVGLPAYVIWVLSAVMPDSTVGFRASGEAVQLPLAEAVTVFVTPMVAALLSAIAGLFLMDAAANDGRLVVAGYRPVEVVLARLGLLGVVSGLATAVALSVMATTFTPEGVLAFAMAVWLGALAYGMAGIVVGTTLDRLPGVYLLLFGSMIDLFLFQNPLATDQPALAAVLPGHYPVEAAMAAAFTGAVDSATVGLAVGVVALLAVAGTAAFYRALHLE